MAEYKVGGAEDVPPELNAAEVQEVDPKSEFAEFSKEVCGCRPCNFAVLAVELLAVKQGKVYCWLAALLWKD